MARAEPSDHSLHTRSLCSPSSKWVPGDITGEVKDGEERNWPPYLTIPAARKSELKYLSMMFDSKLEFQSQVSRYASRYVFDQMYRLLLTY